MNRARRCRTVRRIIASSLEAVLRFDADNEIEYVLNSFTTNDRLQAGSIVVGTPTIVVVGFDGSDIVIRQNGAEVGRVTPTGSYASTGSWVLFSSSEPTNSTLAEFILIKGWNTPGIQALERSWSSRYNIALAA